MNSQQINAAMKNRLPVTCGGKRYDRIIEYIAWYDNNGKRRLSVGLLQDRTYYRVLADKVELANK